MSTTTASVRRTWPQQQQSIQRRRILVIPSEYPDPTDPRQFNGNWAEEQVRAVAAYHDVAVVYPLMTAQRGRGRIEDGDYHGVRTVTVHYRHVRKTWITPHVAAAWRGLRYVRPELRPECIHAHGLYPAGFAAVLIGRALRMPVVVTEHWGQLRTRIDEGGRLVRSVLRFTLRHATQVVAVSRFLASEMRDVEPHSKIMVVPNVIGPNFLEIEPVPSRHERGECELLFVGSIRDNRKGLEELLRALRVNLDTPGTPPCRLTIIGEGRKREWFEELATTLGLRDRCRFMGNRSREEVAEAMQAADVFVMPSKYETFGVVYAEAMACGKPVIACLGGPAEEIVPEWAGVLVTPGDHMALAGALASVTSHLESYDARRISDYARERFGPEMVATAISRVYERAIAAQGKGKASAG